MWFFFHLCESANKYHSNSFRYLWIGWNRSNFTKIQTFTCYKYDSCKLFHWYVCVKLLDKAGTGTGGKSYLIGDRTSKCKKSKTQNCSQLPLLAAVEPGFDGVAKSPQSSKSEFENPVDWVWLGFKLKLDRGARGAGVGSVGPKSRSLSNKLSTAGSKFNRLLLDWTLPGFSWGLITELSLFNARLPPETEVGSLPAAEAPPGGGGKTIPPKDPLAEAPLGRLVAPPPFASPGE